MLENLGMISYLLLGIVIGAGIMYFFEVFMDWREDQEELKKQEAEEYKRTHRNSGHQSALIPEHFVTYRDGTKKILRCNKCALCGFLYTVNEHPATCIDCGAEFEEEKKNEK